MNVIIFLLDDEGCVQVGTDRYFIIHRSSGMYLYIFMRASLD